MVQRLSNDPEVIVIGAGAAGIAAARRLTSAGVRVIVLEAAHRVGGRAFTDHHTFGRPYDQGCAWLQGPADLPHVELAAREGFALLDHSGARTALFVGGRRATPTERGRYRRTAEKIDRALRGAGDVAAGACMPECLPFAGSVLAWIGALDHGVDHTELSAADFAAYPPYAVNSLVVRGFGDLIARFGRNLPIRLNTPVRRVHWGGHGVRVETAGAGTLKARACIVTVSTGVLASGTLQFAPQLPGWKRDAISQLPMGLLAKVALEFDGGRFGLRRNEWLTYQINPAVPARACFFLSFPFGSNLMIGFVGGRFGWELSAAGPDAAIDFALGELATCLGSSVRRHFRRGHLTGWASNPFTLGAYAAARPGCYGARARLAEPLGDRLFFAGEAVGGPYIALAAGAHLSGEAAAEAVLGTLGAPYPGHDGRGIGERCARPGMA